MKAPDPNRFLRWGDRDGVQDLDWWIDQVFVPSLKNSVRNGGEKALTATLRSIIADVFRAGHALGKSEAEHALREVVSERVKAAIAGIAIEAAKCPHCTGLGCSECGDTGKYHANMRLR